MTRSAATMMKLGLAALASSSALASVLESRGTAFSVDAVPAPAPHGFDRAAEAKRIQAKFPASASGPDGGLHVRQESDEADFGQEGSVVARPERGGLSYMVPTVIGNQTFQMIYDTGSADLWVYSNESSPYQSLGHLTYAPTPSAHLVPGYNWSISYVYGGVVEGVVYTDTVRAGEAVAVNQSVESATRITVEFPSDGILGLASSSINQVRPVAQKTFFETLLPTLRRKLFAANLRLDGNGTWDFGHLVSGHYRNRISYVPVQLPFKHWTINVGPYAVGASAPLGSVPIGKTIVDSGTSLVYLPDNVVNDYYSHVPGHELTVGGSHDYPCNVTLPDLRFKIGSADLSIPGSDMKLGVTDKTRNMCAGALGSNKAMRSSVLGNLFMRNYYVVHSLEDGVPKMGFAHR